MKNLFHVQYEPQRYRNVTPYKFRLGVILQCKAKWWLWLVGCYIMFAILLLCNVESDVVVSDWSVCVQLFYSLVNVVYFWSGSFRRLQHHDNLKPMQPSFVSDCHPVSGVCCANIPNCMQKNYKWRRQNLDRWGQTVLNSHCISTKWPFQRLRASNFSVGETGFVLGLDVANSERRQCLIEFNTSNYSLLHPLGWFSQRISVLMKAHLTWNIN